MCAECLNPLNRDPRSPGVGHRSEHIFNAYLNRRIESVGESSIQSTGRRLAFRMRKSNCQRILDNEASSTIRTWRLSNCEVRKTSLLLCCQRYVHTMDHPFKLKWTLPVVVKRDGGTEIGTDVERLAGGESNRDRAIQLCLTDLFAIDK